MIPFTNPEIQLELVRSQAAELQREASMFRLARAFPARRRRFPRRRPDRSGT
jgi:hypothetical protein